MSNLPEPAGAGAEHDALAGPSSLTDLEGWTVDDLVGWLDEHVALFATMEQQTDRARAAVGLALYRLRLELDDGAYGLEVDRLAMLAKVSTRTMRRWREAAEETHELPPADNRSLGRREQIASGQRPATPAPREPSAHSRAARPERVKPDAVRAPARARAARVEQPPLPGAGDWGVVVLSKSVVELASLGVDSLRTLQRRIAEALRLADPGPRRLDASSVADMACPHPKAMRKQLAFGTVCDQQAGGCGAKVT